MGLYNLEKENILRHLSLLQEITKVAFYQMPPMIETPAILMAVFFVSFQVGFSLKLYCNIMFNLNQHFWYVVFITTILVKILPFFSDR